MIQKLKDALASNRREYILFIIASVFIGIGVAVNDTSFANRLSDDLHFETFTRMALEFPRELPGFLVVFVVGALLVFGDIRAAMLANIVAGLGMFAFGWIDSPFALVIFSIFLYSCGQHFYMPLINSIGMSFSKPGQEGRVLGRLASISNFVVLVSAAILCMLYYFLKLPFYITFSIGGIAFFCAAFVFSFMNNHRLKAPKKRFVFKKEFKIFYALSVLNGLRKQFLITFAPWVLIFFFHCNVVVITALYFLMSVLGVLLRPVAGKLIDRLGERKVLMGEATMLFILCFGYIFAESAKFDVFGLYLPVLIFAACYVLDNSITFVGMARATYVKKIAPKPEDVSPTLALGISLDHVVAMILPLAGGFLWAQMGTDGYKYVFAVAALVSIANFAVARHIKIPQQKAGTHTELPVETPAEIVQPD
ncbi:MAG: MFS transporter [Clostridia bacterium]